MIRTQFRLAGHPIHPMLIPFPIAFFVGGAVFDVAYVWTGNATWYTVATWMLVSGIVGALAAGAAGLLIEVHADPALALSDGPQAIPLADLGGMLAFLRDGDIPLAARGGASDKER